MSTRCQIGLYNEKPESLEKPEVLLYKHSDGYPDGVLQDLKDFCVFFKAKRGLNDTEYTGARLVQYLTNEDDKMYSKSPYDRKNEGEYLTGIYGYGICNSLHGDIEYYYAIYPNSIEVYEANGEWEGMKLLKVVEIK